MNDGDRPDRTIDPGVRRHEGEIQPGVYGGVLGLGEEFDPNKNPKARQPTPTDHGAGAGTDPDHRGKGPRGYQRTDHLIRDDACEHLSRDPHVDASEIHVTVERGEVTLSGTVPDRAQKRLAEAGVEHVHGVTDVHNHLKVQAR